MLKVYSPFDNHLIKEIPFSDWSSINDAITTSYNLFNNISKHIPAFERVEILEKLIELMKINAEELTLIAAEEGGKPYIDSKIEVNRAINGVKLAIDSISNMKGEQIPMGHTPSSINRIGFTIKEPIGVIASISAFNHPVNLIVHQVITAIAAGCPVLIKPALTTPLSCIKLVDLLYSAGLPEDWCKVIICTDEFAEKLATDPRINYLSFIGSAKVGWHLRSKLPAGTRCAMEHGGVAPVIVERDADIKELIPTLTKGGFYHAGQVCVSVQRVFIHDDNLEGIIKKLIEEAEKLKVGNPLHKDSEVGPLILNKEVDRVETWVNEAIKEGAKLLTGGKRISDCCFQPTILLNPSANSKVSKLEIFGPVICIYSYKNIDDAISQANSLEFAFQASVFTKNIDKAIFISKRLNASSVMINDHTAFRVDWMPFGGRDSSGIGVGGIQFSINEMSREKLIVIKSSEI